MSQPTWKDKKIKVLLYGDYAFLCNMFGLSGARATHFCLWRTQSPADRQLPLKFRGETSVRTLHTLKNDNKRFVKECKGVKSKAAQYNNVIHEPLWDIEISYVCPPYLHILLGIVKKHHDLLEAECDAFDQKIAKEIAKTDYVTE